MHLSQFISAIEDTPLSSWKNLTPWRLTGQSESIVRMMMEDLDRFQFNIENEVAVHVTATVEKGVILKGPAIIGPGVFVGAHAYIRGGNWIHERCSIGPGCELKSSFVFAESRLAHFNFVGDSIIGRDVNLEAGSIICNHRNERVHKTIYVRADGIRLNTGIEKFGTLIGDHSRLGANSVIAPGTLIQPSTVIERGALRDDDATEI